jgi:myosin heavy subunit
MRARFVEDLEKQRIKRVNILLVKLQAAIRGRVYRQAFLKILRVRRDLRAAMLTVDTNLSYLESMLAECVRLDMHDELIRNATALVALTKRTHELRAALLLATNGRHFEQLPELLEQARQHFGAAQCLNEDAYVQASQILEQISTYRVDLVAAVGSRNIEQLQQTLQRALELRMNHHQPELDAQTLLDRLLAEQSALSLLGTALNSKSLSELQAAVAAAQALDGFENQLINECQSMIEQIKTMISELQSAMQNKSLEQLSLSIGQLREFANCDSQLSSLLSDAEAIKAVIEREQYAIELLKTAASARDASQIQTGFFFSSFGAFLA